MALVRTSSFVPSNITLLPLPPKCPELNPLENLWQFLRDNWLSNRVFPSYRCYRRSLLPCLEQARRPALDLIMSIGLRDWAHRF